MALYSCLPYLGCVSTSKREGSFQNHECGPVPSLEVLLLEQEIHCWEDSGSRETA